MRSFALKFVSLFAFCNNALTIVVGSAVLLPHVAAAQEAGSCETNSEPVAVFSTRISGSLVGALERKASVAFERPKLDFSKEPSNAATVFSFEPNSPQQAMNGFGGALTESCAMNLAALPKAQLAQAMSDIFSKETGAGFDFLRLPLGSSDFADSSRGNYTYDDLPGAASDPEFRHFDLKRDEKSFVLIRQAKLINPRLGVLISPWSAPAWMKKPRLLKGGSLNPAHYQDFANYFVRAIRELELRGVPVDSLTIENEPGYANDIYPSMGMSTEEQIRFLRDYLAPTLRREELATRIFILDHNYDMWPDVNQMLDDPILKAQVHGVAYHCYSGDYPDMQGSMTKHPDVPTFQTECSGTLGSDESSSFAWWLQSHSIGASAMGGTGSLGWNLCLDQNGGPTNHGCEGCQGLVTIDRSKKPAAVRFNPEFKALAQVSRVVEPGSRMLRVTASANTESLPAVAFKNPSGTESFAAWNGAAVARKIRVQRGAGCAAFEYELAVGEAASFLWATPSLDKAATTVW